MFAQAELPDVSISHVGATFDIAQRQPPCRRRLIGSRFVVLGEIEMLGMHKALPWVQLLTIASLVCVCSAGRTRCQ